MLQAVPQDVAAMAQQKAAKAVTAAKLKAVDGILWGHKEAWKKGEQILLSNMRLACGCTLYSQGTLSQQVSDILLCLCIA